MSMTNELSKLHWVNVLVPAADRFNTDPATDIVDVQGEGILFLIQCGASLTGTATVTAEGCDDTTPTTNTDVPFIYRVMTTSPDTWGAWTVGVSATGFTTTGGTDNLAYQVFVDADDLGALGFAYARLQLTEVVDAAVTAGVMAAVSNIRYAVQASSLVD